MPAMIANENCKCSFFAEDKFAMEIFYYPQTLIGTSLRGFAKQSLHLFVNRGIASQSLAMTKVTENMPSLTQDTIG